MMNNLSYWQTIKLLTLFFVAGSIISACSEMHNTVENTYNVHPQKELRIIKTTTNFNSWIDGAIADQKSILQGQRIATGKLVSKSELYCSICHSAVNQQEAPTPQLDGMPAQYIYKQLSDFASGRRTHPIMGNMASTLTDIEKKSVSMYYASFEKSLNNLEAVSEGSLGWHIAYKGESSGNIPACFNCHGIHGRGIAPWSPPLVGQNADYLMAQLFAWKSGERSNDTNDVMGSIVRRLSSDEIKAISHYLSSLNN